MAERRMFAKTVTEDDHFMSLSSSAQALYLHLSMSADDDGFCNQVNMAMFRSHASVQDLEALLEKRYIYQFDNGVIVIKHWRMANALRKDRYTPTKFKEELAKLKLDENGAYTWLTHGCQVVAERLPQDRLGKDSIGNINTKVSKLDKPTSDELPPYEEIIAYLNKKTGKKFRVGNDVRKLINGRYKDKFTKEDFFKVIDNKCNEWLNDNKMKEYLRPQTLFGTKFDSYLNSNVVISSEDDVVYDSSNNPKFTKERLEQLKERRNQNGQD